MVKLNEKHQKVKDKLERMLKSGEIRPVNKHDNVWVSKDGLTIITKFVTDKSELWKERVLNKNKYIGYWRVGINIGPGKWINEYVHRLVGLAWIDNPENLKQINHKDGNKDNNHADNLEWTTSRQNIRHSIDSLNVNVYGHGKKVKVTKNKWGNYGVPIVDQNGDKYKSYREAADKLGIDYQAICAYMAGLRKTAQGYTFERIHSGEDNV